MKDALKTFLMTVFCSLIFVSHSWAEMTTLEAKGKVLYDESAGGSGCAICHGSKAQGNADAGAPLIRGVVKSNFDAATSGSVPVMQYIKLNKAEKNALYAFLQYLYVADQNGSLNDLPAQASAPNLQTEAAMSAELPVLPGKKIFEETAGGVGCQSCHAMDGHGNIGPDIRGRSEADIRRALKTVEPMSFIRLSSSEISDVADYLTYLLESAPQ